MHERDPGLPLNSRAELLGRMMPILRAGECCSLVGTSGVGKSNLVQFLQRLDVQAHYWGDDRTWVVSIDTHGLVFDQQPAEFAALELMIHRLIREAERRAAPAALIDDLDRLHTRLMHQPGTLLALRYLERICARLCQGAGLQIVFVFDQFDDIWRQLDARFYQNLRHLRDEFKYQLVYLTLTREQLPRARERTRGDLREVEAFWELFSAHVFGLGMASLADANITLDRIANRRGIEVDDRTRQALFTASGQHPGLLRALFWALHYQPDTPLDHAHLAAIPSIASECAKIWHDLFPEEQDLVRLLAAGSAVPEQHEPTVAELRLKEIVHGDQPALFSPVFAAFVRQHSNAGTSAITIDPRQRQVWIEGVLVHQALSPLEFKLLEFLARRAGDVCPRDEIIREVYGEQEYDVNDERLNSLLRRLRESLGEDVREPRFLITHRGVGIQLVNAVVL